MACTRDKQQVINQYLDEEMTLLESKQFEEHLHSCPDCEKHVRELKKTTAIIQSASHFEAPKDFTAGVMDRLPKQSKTKRWQQWIRRHPIVLTAAVFFLVFVTSLSAGFGAEEEIVVRGDGHFIINESERTVIIPEGSAIQGDLFIRNGDVEVNGEVSGDITVVNGRHLQASSAQISGDIEEINQTFEWLWFEMKTLWNDAVPFLTPASEEE
ncbi:zf-HC2 domain-containing protein [Bacillus daqingensis]|uniref:Anti-sigma-W factor RsiW n=1 Tax=Bacillus daqingensis TaxID=872396 RepID=A0ABV9NXE9_9BACI